MMTLEAKEFGPNRCPFFMPGQMMTPDKGSCRGVISSGSKIL